MWEYFSKQKVENQAANFVINNIDFSISISYSLFYFSNPLIIIFQLYHFFFSFFFTSLFFLLHTLIPIPHSPLLFISCFFLFFNLFYSRTSTLSLSSLFLFFYRPAKCCAPLREGWWRSRVTGRTRPSKSPCSTTSSSSLPPDKSACLFFLFLIFLFWFDIVVIIKKRFFLVFCVLIMWDIWVFEREAKKLKQRDERRERIIFYWVVWFFFKVEKFI